jgi:hypothetical protein
VCSHQPTIQAFLTRPRRGQAALATVSSFLRLRPLGQSIEAVGDCGCPFRVGDTDDLAAKMTQLLADPSAAALAGRRGFDRARSYYSWDSVARLYASAFEAASRGGSIAA